MYGRVCIPVVIMVCLLSFWRQLLCTTIGYDTPFLVFSDPTMISMV
jgi:hypothetical protein